MKLSETDTRLVADALWMSLEQSEDAFTEAIGRRDLQALRRNLSERRRLARLLRHFLQNSRPEIK